MTTPRDPIEHAAHDTFLIASLATRESDAADEALTEARAMVGSCTGCAALYADFIAVSTAIPTSAVPPRPRDFRLTDADAARLQPRGWRRFMRTIGSPRDSITRPLALGFTTLGIAGLLFASLPSAFLGAGAATGGAIPSTVGNEAQEAPGDGAAASAAPASLPAAPAAAPSAEASTQNLTQTDGPDASDGDTSNVFEGSGEGNQGDNGRTTDAGAEDLAIRDDASGLSAIAIIAGSLLIVGLGIFLLRWSARRFGD